MRIAVLSAYGADVNQGGAEVAIERLVEGLEQLGSRVAIISGLPSADAQPNLIGTVTQHPWRASRPRHLANIARDTAALPSRRLEAMLATYRPAAVLTHNLPGLSTSAWVVASRLGIPVVHTIHDYYLLCRRTTLIRDDGGPCRDRPFCEVRRRSILRHAKSVGYVLAPSRYVADRHTGLFPSAPPIEVITNPADTAGLQSIPAPGRLRRVGYLGRLDATKGIPVLLRSAASLMRLGITLAIAGDGPLRPEVARAAERGLLEYRGRVVGAAKRAFLAECDAGAAPSLWNEPGGPTLAMTEWLTAGRPVFASLRGGHSEVAARGIGVIGMEPTAASFLAAVDGHRAEAAFASLVGEVARDVAPSPTSHARRYLAAVEVARARTGRP